MQLKGPHSLGERAIIASGLFLYMIVFAAGAIEFGPAKHFGIHLPELIAHNATAQYALIGGGSALGALCILYVFFGK